MPTVLFILGWRFFFYANENDEPVHIHARKGGMECKFWLEVDDFEIREAYAYNLGARPSGSETVDLPEFRLLRGGVE